MSFEEESERRRENEQQMAWQTPHMTEVFHSKWGDKGSSLMNSIFALTVPMKAGSPLISESQHVFTKPGSVARLVYFVWNESGEGRGQKQEGTAVLLPSYSFLFTRETTRSLLLSLLLVVVAGRA